MKIAMVPAGQTKYLLGIACWNGIPVQIPFAHLSLVTSTWQWSTLAIHLPKKLICPYFLYWFNCFCLQPLRPKLRCSHIAASVLYLFRHLRLNYSSSIGFGFCVWKHVVTPTQILKHRPCLRRADLTPADCRCDGAIISCFMSGQIQLPL